MSSLALMRWLESAPSRYDAGMRILTLGRAAELHAWLAEKATPEPGAHVLEIGCGTGAVTERLVARGARVTALDQSPEMLEQARARLAGAAPGRVEWQERTAAEIDALPEAGFDAVVASLCLSEMAPGERSFVLEQARLRLRAGGVLAAGDEGLPREAGWRALHRTLRLPQAAAGWLLVGSVSKPLPDLPGEVAAAGLHVREVRRWLRGGLVAVAAKRPA